MKRLLPVMRMQISLLLRHMTPERANGPELHDLQQDLLVELFRSGAQELRRWNPEAGLSLEGFVRLITRRFVARRIVRAARRRERFLSTAPDALDALGPEQPDVVERDDHLGAVLDALSAQMSARDHGLFMRLFVEEQPTAVAAREEGMSVDALKKWRSRMYARARRIAAQIDAGEIAGGVSPSAGSEPRKSMSSEQRGDREMRR